MQIQGKSIGKIKCFYMPGVAKGMSRKDFFLLFFPGPFKNFLVFCHLPFDSLWFLRVPLGFLGFFIVPYSFLGFLRALKVP